MSFKSDVVEIRKIFWKFLNVLALFNHVLFFKPTPSRVDFTIVFCDQLVSFDPVFV